MEIRTHLVAARLADLEALRSGGPALDAALDRALGFLGLDEEELRVERVPYRQALVSGALYAGRSDPEKRRLDRIVAQIMKHELGGDPLLTAHAWRFDWALAFIERRGAREAAELWYPLAHGRRLSAPQDPRPGEPEHVPCYAWLSAAECGKLAALLPAVVSSMEEERSRAGLLRRFQRRGSSCDAAYLLAIDVGRALERALGSGRDLLVVSDTAA